MTNEFKETPIGKIPKEWDIAKLGNIAKVSSGNTAPQDVKYFENGKYPFIRMKHLQELEENKFPKKFDLINDLAIKDLKLKKFKKGSILLPKSGESIKLERRAILKEDSYVVNHLAVIEVEKKDKVDNLYLFYYLSKLRTWEFVTKTTMPSLNLSTIKDFPIPLPPLPEQKKIAEILSTIDKAIEKTDALIHHYQQLKNALMQKLFTEGIGHTKFKPSPLGQIPAEWDVVKIGDIIEFAQYGLSIKMHDKGQYPIVKMDSIIDGKVMPVNLKYVDLDEETFNKFKLEKGDILVNRTNSYELVGKTGIFMLEGDYVFASYLIRLRPKKDIVDSAFLTYYLILSQDRLRQIATRGASQANINATNLKKFLVPLPPLDEQKKIAQIFITIDNKIEAEIKTKEEFEKLKQGMMDKLLTGKVRVKVGEKSG